MAKKTADENLEKQIKELQKTVKSLKASKERYENLADMLPQIIVETDLKGTLIFANRKTFETTGYSKKDFNNGLNAAMLVIPEDRPKVAGNRQKVLEGNILKGNEYTALRKDGSTYPVMVYSSHKIENGELNGVRSIIIDITEQKSLENKLRSERDKLKKALSEVKTLRGFLPICASCKKIRDDKGYWRQIESYIRKHSEAEFSHSICPDCAQKLYPKYVDENGNVKKKN